MNMHLPQNVLAETELRHLAAIPYQMISPSANAPIIGIYQDSLLGSYRFTRPGVKLTPRDAMNLLMMCSHVDVDALLENKNALTSFDVLSQIISPLTLKYKTKLFEENEDFETSNNVMEIRNGKYVRGQMEKSVLASTTKGIIHRIFNDYGPMTAANFIDDLQNIVTEYMKSSSFSVGVSDLIANKKTQDQILQVIHDKKVEVQNEIDKLHLGIFENDTSNSNMVQFELNLNNILNKATEQSGKIGRKSLSKDNRFLMIVESGSKGSLVNISQMISCLGQQNVDGKRISYGFDDRTLPHYKKFDDSPAARGFIENSYISGLTAPELFFHAMGGRIGLIDTAVKSVTWETPIVIIENQKPMYIEIGKWIDGQLDTAKPGEVQHFTERQMELMNIDSDTVYIPTTDEDGNVTWGEVTAITRHDPGTELYEIKTSGGKSVIVTESKSLLIWNPETKKLKEMLTPDIKVGDCVPVTESLCKPPVVLEAIDMSDYLPKTEYVYGSEFHIAVEQMKQQMKNRQKIPAGWWKQANGTDFVLPYTKKSSLQRTIVRSNIDNIKPGFIYPYHAQRKETCISDKFELNQENGIFIGLFLAEGHCTGNTISITNNNADIQNFVTEWFNKHSITNTIYMKTNNKGYVTTSVIGNCSVLSTFLKQLVGHKSENKHIPTEAYIANESFVIGLLNGYYSGDGSISRNSIDVSSASSRLIDGISMLCSRLGIFGKVSKSQLKQNNFGTKNIKPSYRLRISAQWGQLFSNTITLIEEKKNAKMKAIQWRKSHMNFKTYNNVVLDKIVEINIIDTKNHPKVYDLTIPTTLNFGLANGLQVRDTSTTGYIQRRLIKGLEDLKVEYDMTVRNNRGKIVQFAYGDDGFDSTKAENQFIPLVGMSVEDIYLHYDIPGIHDENSKLINIFAKGAITRIRKQKTETIRKIKDYVEKMLEIREDIVKNVFKYKNENTVRVPVAFQHIIANIQGQLGLNSHSITDITPLDAFELVENTFEKLKKLHFAPPTPLFEILYYYYLSPKDLLVNKRFHRKGIELLLETVVLKYKQALVHPGEMVGVIAGQSIGEPTTQLTLNSVTYETEIVVRNHENKIKKVQIGDFVKEHISKSNKVEYMEDKDTTYAELCIDNEYYEIPSANELGETVWTRIEAVTQHPVINEDGTNTMLKITTKGCREINITKAKSILQLVDGKIQGVNGKDLKIGDYLPVSNKTLDIVRIYESDISDSEKRTQVELLNSKKYDYSENNWIPNIINGELVMENRNDKMPDLLFDQITNIEEIQNTTNYAYDLTVEHTRNFDCYNGICCRDTFHLSGVASKSNVTRGVPRIEEILRLTSNPKNPSLTVHLKPMDELDKDRASVYANMLEHTRLIDVVKSVQICFDPSDRASNITEDKDLLEKYYAFENMVSECNEDAGAGTSLQKSKWIVRMEINAETLLDKNITMDDIHFAIKSTNPDIFCIYSDYNDSNLVFRIRLNADVFKKTKSASRHPLDQSDDIYLLKNFQDKLLQNIVLRGVHGINNVLPRKLQNMVVKEEGKYVRKDIWVLDTTGTNLLDVLAMDFIDASRTYGNDITEVFDILGIEAARQILYNEFVEVMEFSDVYINYHHLSLLCDRMSVTKNMVAIFRSGLHNDNIGPIAKATFEVHTEILLHSARHADFDEMRGVSANVMCGQMGYYGTGAFNVVLDMKEINKLEDAEIAKGPADISIQSDKKSECAKSNIEIKNNIASIHQENEGICQDNYDMGF
jgi:DNA-directed RNA polymerase beta' subunit